jgi:hypothetical protein
MKWLLDTAGGCSSCNTICGGERSSLSHRLEDVADCANRQRAPARNTLRIRSCEQLRIVPCTVSARQGVHWSAQSSTLPSFYP